MVISLRFVLGIGAALIVLVSIGVVGILGIRGMVRSAEDLTVPLQRQTTARLRDTVEGYFARIEADADVLVAALRRDPDADPEPLLKAFVRHKPDLNDVTIARSDRTNLMVWIEDGEIGSEQDGDLDEEAWVLAEEGRPGDDSEGFDDIFMEPIDRRPVISYTRHLGTDSQGRRATLFVDLDLATLSSRIAAVEGQIEERLHAHDDNGQVIFHSAFGDAETYASWDRVPHVTRLEDSVPAAVFAAQQGGEKAPTRVTAGGREYLISVATLPGIGESDWHAVSAIPLDVVLAPAHARAREITIVGGTILVVALILTLLVAWRVMRPVRRLADAAGSVEKLELGQAKGWTDLSEFKEIRRTEQAFGAMLRGLEIFSKYVPKSLVRSLIAMETAGAGVAPEERTVTVMFTDIKGYSTISDGMQPRDLASLLNDYFGTILQPIIESGGTVDKFIGDAVMAFWNAPLEMDDHRERALRAALEIQRVGRAMNDRRAAQGQPPLVTRIGIHTGPVLVGNIGTPDRLNYTIVGDAVNVAARLESLGKEVGETLCVSGDVRETVGDAAGFRWREVGEVVLRGRSSATKVFTVDGAA